MSATLERTRTAFAILLLLCGCSGERKVPQTTAPPSAGNAASPATQQGGGSPGTGGGGREQGGDVRNSPPEVRSVRFLPGDAGKGTGLGVEAEGYDPDGDAVRLEIAWRKNGEPAGEGNRLEGPLKRGDRITVAITPFDGKTRGKVAELSREVRNTPPLIEGQEEFQVNGALVTFRVRASDPDGDPIHYSLKDAPPAMRIDPSNGQVRWEAPRGTTGKVPFTVTASDGFGGEANARFSVSISQEPVSGAETR